MRFAPLPHRLGLGAGRLLFLFIGMKCFLSLSALALCLAGAISAQVTYPQPYLQALDAVVFAPGAQTVLSLTGTGLDTVQSAVLARRSSALVKVDLLPAKEGKGRVLANWPSSLAEGWWDFRVLTPHGLSNPRAVLVSRRPVTLSPGRNDSPEKALNLPSEGVVSGQFKAGAAHWFAINLKRGQRLQGVHGQGTTDSRCRLMGWLEDPQGRLVARLRDGGMEALISADGQHRLKLHDMMFGGSVDHHFVFEWSCGPRLWARGRDAVVGWNLPGGKDMNGVSVDGGPPVQWLAFDPAKPPSWIAAAIAAPQLPSLPQKLGLAANNAGAARVEGQVAHWTGWFPLRGEAMVHEWPVKKGDRLLAQVISHALGFASDALLMAEWRRDDGKGAVTFAAEANDVGVLQPAPTTRWQGLDPSLSLEAPADGTLRLLVSDPGNAANGRRLPFELRLSLRGKEPARLALDAEQLIGFHSATPPAAATAAAIAAPNLLRGGSAILEVYVPGRDASSAGQPIEASAEGSAIRLQGWVGAGRSMGYVSLSAPEQVGHSVFSLSPALRVQNLVWPVADVAREAPVHRLSSPAVFAVSEHKAPVLVELALKPGTSATLAGKLSLQVKLRRSAEFKEAMKLRILGLQESAKAPEVTVPAGANEATIDLDPKTLKLPAGDLVLYAQGTAKMGIRAQAAAIEAATAAKERAAAAVKGLAGPAKKEPEAKAAVPSSAQLALAEAEKTLAALLKSNPSKDVVALVHSPLLRLELR